MCVMKQLLSQDVLMVFYVNLIRKESRNFHKYLKPLVLEEEKKHYSERCLFHLHVPVLFIRSPDKVDRSSAFGKSKYPRDPYPTTFTRDSAWQHVPHGVCLSPQAPGQVDHMTELGLHRRKTVCCGSPHQTPHPWPQSTCPTLTFYWGEPEPHNKSEVQLTKESKTGLFQLSNSSNCLPWICRYLYSKHWGGHKS